MPTYLHIDELRTDTAQKWHRSEYELRRVEYELSRSVSGKGEISSGMTGGRIKMLIEGFGDEELFDWLFDQTKRKSGEVTTTDGDENSIEKFTFADAKAIKYRLHFDADTKKAITAELVIEAGEITTENHLHFKRK